MSFSSNVKKELRGLTDIPKHCAIAQLSAMAAFLADTDAGGLYFHGDEMQLEVVKELVRGCFKTGEDAFVTGEDELFIADAKLRDDIHMAIRWKDTRTGESRHRFSSGVLLKNECCRKAFLRGAFLCGGSVNDPHGAYHLEIICKNEEEAEELLKIMRGFLPEAKSTPRKGKVICYIKEAEGITDMLNVMGAVVSQMEFFNTMILKDVRNDLNRKVNCETANLKKTVSAAVKQIRDIEFIRDTKGLSFLKENLQEMAALRLENPDMSLKDLGELLDPSLGRSGVNHRLKAISEVAESLRKQADNTGVFYEDNSRSG